MSQPEVKNIVMTKQGNKTLLDGTRVMTEEELRNMSNGSFKLYHRRAKDLRKWAHNLDCVHDAKIVTAADYLSNAVEREKRRRWILSA
jgi:hypothetical protein